jgi:hypothetical protein
MTKKQVQLVLKTADIPSLDGFGNNRVKYDSNGYPTARYFVTDDSRYYINLYQSNYKFKGRVLT